MGPGRLSSQATGRGVQWARFQFFSLILGVLGRAKVWLRPYRATLGPPPMDITNADVSSPLRKYARVKNKSKTKRENKNKQKVKSNPMQECWMMG
jgi:hypothetical protein